MSELSINIKKLDSTAVIPQYAHTTDAGLDLTATSLTYEDGKYIYGTGLAVEIPEGYVGLLFPRSSNCKKDLFLTNSVGVIDSGYRGEIKLVFKMPVTYATEEEFAKWRPTVWEVGDRVGQLIIIPYPKITFNEVEELNDSDRGTNGFGSSNKNE